MHRQQPIRQLSIIRTARTLERCSLVQRSPITPPAGVAPWPARGAWSVVRGPLPAEHPLVRVWSGLAGPRPLDARLLHDVSTVLAQTVPEGIPSPPGTGTAGRSPNSAP